MINVSVTGKNLINAVVERGSYSANSLDKVNSDSTRCKLLVKLFISIKVLQAHYLYQGIFKFTLDCSKEKI